MSFTTVQICNRALIKIGQHVIMSLDDPSDHAVTLKAVYAPVRDTVLSSRIWDFALTRKMLPALEDVPPSGYARSFQLPSDCLRLAAVGRAHPASGGADYRVAPDAAWRVEGDTIRTDLPAPLPVVYVRREENPAKYPAAFAEALACKLAAELCERVAGGQSRRQLLREEYREALREAGRVNAVQRAPQSSPDGTWMLARVSPGGY